MCTKLGHNSVALPTSEGRREGDRICPSLTVTSMSLQGDLHSMGWKQISFHGMDSDYRVSHNEECKVNQL